MFTRARARIALAVQAAAMALGFTRANRGPSPSIGPVMSKGTAEAPKVSRPRAERNAPRKRRHSSFWLGSARTQTQERARRVRQIETGQLTMSNGLHVRGWLMDTHGRLSPSPNGM